MIQKKIKKKRNLTNVSLYQREKLKSPNFIFRFVFCFVIEILFMFCLFVLFVFFFEKTIADSSKSHKGLLVLV